MWKMWTDNNITACREIYQRVEPDLQLLKLLAKMDEERNEGFCFAFKAYITMGWKPLQLYYPKIDESYRKAFIYVS